MTIDISKFSSGRILVVGDLMLDEYVWGQVERISPEAPVQVVSVLREENTLGGAGNVVSNLAALGAAVSVAGVIGTDASGRRVLRKLNQLGVDTSGVIKEAGRCTTCKTRIIAGHQQVLRIDRESGGKVTPASFAAVAAAATKMTAAADVVLISDYGKGLISKTLVSRLAAAARKKGKTTIVDPKGLDFKKYAGATLLTPNKKEAGLAAAIEIADDTTLFRAGRHLLKTAGVDKLLITCGRDGMVFFEPQARPYKIETTAREVYDVSGAGDTVLAVLGLGLAAGLTFKQALGLANTAAGIVVGKVGTAPVSAAELSAAVDRDRDDAFFKQKKLDELSDLVRQLKKKNRRVVLTNGCFDLLHVGHIRLLTASRQLGDVLIVAIDDDNSVRRLKGPHRPVISARERVRIISALDSVDYVVVFSSRQLKKLLATVRPDILTKGSNYQTAEVHGREIVEQYGGRIELIPITEDVSSTKIINHIKNK